MSTETKNKTAKAEDRILWQSRDAAVIVRRRVHTAMRWPPHKAPIITLDVLPREGTRIRPLPNGRVDLCLEHEAQVALITALNEADPTVRYGIPAHVPTKPLERKQRYERLNASRWAKKRRWK